MHILVNVGYAISGVSRVIVTLKLYYEDYCNFEKIPISVPIKSKVIKIK